MAKKPCPIPIPDNIEGWVDVVLKYEVRIEALEADLAETKAKLAEIPDTSQREAELEGVIIEFQAQLDARDKAIGVAVEKIKTCPFDTNGEFDLWLEQIASGLEAVVQSVGT